MATSTQLTKTRINISKMFCRFATYISKTIWLGLFYGQDYNHITIVLDQIAKNNQTWHKGDQSGGLNVGTPSLTHLMKENKRRDHMMDIISTNIALLNKRLTKNDQFEDANYIGN
ncbi:hypothetical protein HAX54_050545, partial [Datura stramonium]|nr:hypothetical protein [Datura stramonium]